MLIVDISPPGKDKHRFLHMIYDPGIPISSLIQENTAATSPILPVFAVWQAATYVCDSQEQKGIPGIDQYICGNNISTIEDMKFRGGEAKSITGK